VDVAVIRQQQHPNRFRKHIYIFLNYFSIRQLAVIN